MLLGASGLFVFFSVKWLRTHLKLLIDKKIGKFVALSKNIFLFFFLSTYAISGECPISYASFKKKPIYFSFHLSIWKGEGQILQLFKIFLIFFEAFLLLNSLSSLD